MPAASTAYGSVSLYPSIIKGRILAKLSRAPAPPKILLRVVGSSAIFLSISLACLIRFDFVPGSDDFLASRMSFICSTWRSPFVVPRERLSAHSPNVLETFSNHANSGTDSVRPQALSKSCIILRVLGAFARYPSAMFIFSCCCAPALSPATISTGRPNSPARRFVSTISSTDSSDAAAITPRVISASLFSSDSSIPDWNTLKPPSTGGGGITNGSGCVPRESVDSSFDRSSSSSSSANRGPPISRFIEASKNSFI